MKSSPLTRRTPPRRTGPLRRRRKPVVVDPAVVAAREAWKVPRAGFCACGCDRFALHLERHHVVYEQHVRAEGGDVWDLANSILLHPRCHSQHHSAARRIPLAQVPDSALAFAVDLLGEDAAALYFVRRYTVGYGKRVAVKRS